METWADPAHGSVRWQSLFSAGITPTDSLTCGVAHVAAGDTFTLHSHPQAEVYFGLSGSGVVMVDGTACPLSPGVALFIPGGAVHGIILATEPMSWFYVFAADSFDEIAYSFKATQVAALQMPPVGLEPPDEQEFPL
ncbi:MAG: cupin domain-containing protein [Pseudotabrizicola sp.]|uniref:cupin domain-containing protein n=1 Tax=Pseudotabrizicola sp. TaxID=2939647 RepID=UPI0027287DDF|nr:cupin domain-containing protein [Pseudotabrizicola sp.]MDO8882322.1 cupin domain-containing protein [Pseudotabrizicola sp.]MDP2083206.1 cupin domain-containing protein [Pseudotabrizicola sp.]MDZ7572623.1 cupin domain-containing protein [Pseudotabrizicola sp.]